MFTKLLRSTLPLFTAASAMAQATDRPNIIFFLVDDMGWQDTSLPFWTEETPQNARYRTPNMERLANQGVMFTNAYACPVSSPSRCSLLSGMNAARHGVTNWIESYNQDTNASGSNITLPEWNWNGVQPASTATSTDKVHAHHSASSTAEGCRILHHPLWKGQLWCVQHVGCQSHELRLRC